MQFYFVVIFAVDAAALRALQKFELDVFPQTAKRRDGIADYPYAIDGLLSIEQVEKVVQAGYRVELQDPVEKRARAAGNVVEFPDWLAGMKRAMKLERAKR